MKKLIKFLSLALSTICVTMTTAFAVYQMPTYKNSKQFMDHDFTYEFALQIKAYYSEQCLLEKYELREYSCSTTGSHYKAKFNIKSLVMALRKKDPEAALRLVMMICRVFPHVGIFDLDKPELYEPMFYVNKLDKADPFKPLYLGLRDRGDRKGDLVSYAIIE